MLSCAAAAAAALRSQLEAEARRQQEEREALQRQQEERRAREEAAEAERAALNKVLVRASAPLVRPSCSTTAATSLLLLLPVLVHASFLDKRRCVCVLSKRRDTPAMRCAPASCSSQAKDPTLLPPGAPVNPFFLARPKGAPAPSSAAAGGGGQPVARSAATRPLPPALAPIHVTQLHEAALAPLPLPPASPAATPPAVLDLTCDPSPATPATTAATPPPSSSPVAALPQPDGGDALPLLSPPGSHPHDAPTHVLSGPPQEQLATAAAAACAAPPQPGARLDAAVAAAAAGGASVRLAYVGAGGRAAGAPPSSSWGGPEPPWQGVADEGFACSGGVPPDLLGWLAELPLPPPPPPQQQQEALCGAAPGASAGQGTVAAEAEAAPSAQRFDLLAELAAFLARLERSGASSASASSQVSTSPHPFRWQPVCTGADRS